MNRDADLTSDKVELRDIILGGQDGLVNVFGIALGLFAAHASARVILIAGLAAGVSEAVSMGAVAYTSASADKFRLQSPDGRQSQLIFSAIVVGISALVGSMIPLIPFIFFGADINVYGAIVLSALVLFGLGVYKARATGGSWLRSGFLILFIGLISAFAGFLIGFILKVQ